VAITTAPADFLIPARGAFRQTGMYNGADVALRGRDDEIQVAFCPPINHLLPLCRLCVSREEGEAATGFRSTAK
jgi:hypothetical protein